MDLKLILDIVDFNMYWHSKKKSCFCVKRDEENIYNLEFTSVKQKYTPRNLNYLVSVLRIVFNS